MAERRPHVSLSTKLASALLQMVRPDEDGKFVPVIPYEEAKNLTAEEIVSKFDFDHGVYHAIGGDIRPSNLTPRLRAEHREKTAKIDIPAIAKGKRLRAAQAAHEATMAIDPTPEQLETRRLMLAREKKTPRKVWPKRRFGRST